MHEERAGDNGRDELRGRVEIVRTFDLVPRDHKLNSQGDDGGYDDITECPEMLEAQDTILGYSMWVRSVSSCSKWQRDITSPPPTPFLASVPKAALKDTDAVGRNTRSD